MRMCFAECWDNTALLPGLLGSLCRGGMIAGPILVMASLASFIEVISTAPTASVEAREAATAVLFSAMASAWAWGMAARQKWSRWSLLLTQLLPFALLPELALADPVTVASALVTALIIYVTFWRLRSVREYFDPPPS